MVCQTKEVSICPIHLDAPISLDTLIYLNAPLYVGMLPYVWMAPCMLGCPLCLDALCMLGHPHMFRCPHMFGCPLYIHNTEKACFVRWRGCPYSPIHVDAPCTSTTQRKCLDAPCTYTTQRNALSDEGVSICPIHLDAPLYINNAKKTCFVRLMGCPYATLHSDAPHMFGCPLYV